MLLAIVAISQTKVCENTGDELLDANTIGKCAIEDFKKSEKKEYVKVSTRNRFVRKRKSSYLKNFKKNINTKALVKETNVVKEVVANNSVKEKREITRVEDVLVKNYIRFDEVNNTPVFITCADVSISMKEACVKETFVNNILENFIYPFDAAAEGIEGRVWVRFIIDKDGYVKNITSTGPEKGALLEKEAKRLVNLLPKFVPGKHNNEYVNVEFFMPIDFQLDE